MTHPRTIVRNQVKTILETAAPPGWTVKKGRGRPLDLSQCPFVIIAIPVEQDERGAQRKLRTPQLSVAAYVASATDGDDAADAAAEWIEAALDADATLGGTVSDSMHVRSEIAPHPGGETPVWELTLTYDLRLS